MREIKFRAWVELRHEMVQLTDMHLPLTTPTGGGPVMQYTGLHDKNGREIYEGDIVRNIWTDVNGKDIGGLWEVRFGEYDNSDSEYGSGGHIGFYCQSIGGEFHIRYQEGLHNLPTDGNETIPVVIGNIYENPELVK